MTVCREERGVMVVCREERGVMAVWLCAGKREG